MRKLRDSDDAQNCVSLDRSPIRTFNSSSEIELTNHLLTLENSTWSGFFCSSPTLMSGHCTLSSRKKYALKALSKGPDAMSFSRLFFIKSCRLFARPPDVRESAKDFGSS